MKKQTLLPILLSCGLWACASPTSAKRAPAASPSDSVSIMLGDYTGKEYGLLGKKDCWVSLRKVSGLINASVSGRHSMEIEAIDSALTQAIQASRTSVEITRETGDFTKENKTTLHLSWDHQFRLREVSGKSTAKVAAGTLPVEWKSTKCQELQKMK